MKKTTKSINIGVLLIKILLLQNVCIIYLIFEMLSRAHEMLIREHDMLSQENKNIYVSSIYHCNKNLLDLYGILLKCSDKYMYYCMILM